MDMPYAWPAFNTLSSARHRVIRAITAPKSTKPRRCF